MKTTSFVITVTVILALLKITGTLDWGWNYVFLPAALIVLLDILRIIIVILAYWLTDKRGGWHK